MCKCTKVVYSVCASVYLEKKVDVSTPIIMLILNCFKCSSYIFKHLNSIIYVVILLKVMYDYFSMAQIEVTQAELWPDLYMFLFFISRVMGGHWETWLRPTL